MSLKMIKINATIWGMNGILLVNHFLRSEKFNELHTHIIDSARKMNIDLTLKTNLESATEKINSDFVLFWDKDTNLARRIERSGVPVFNSSDSIEKCDDKARTYIELDGIVAQPKTLIAPKTYFKSDMSDFVDRAINELSFPLVFKECFGSFGEQVFLCNSVEDVLSHVGSKPFLLQEYIECGGTDVRLEVVGGRVVAAMRRSNKNDFRSNITNGGVAEAYTPTEQEARLAVDACKALGLTFGGVDIMQGNTVCEVNSNAHIINIMQTTGVDVAPLIFEEILGRI